MILLKITLLVCAVVLPKGRAVPVDLSDLFTLDPYADSCWREVEWRLTEAVAILRERFELPPSVTSLEGRQQLICLIKDIKTVEDLAALIPVEKKTLKMYVNIARQAIQMLGGKEGIKNLGETLFPTLAAAGTVEVFSEESSSDNEIGQLLFGIVSELLDKNWLGLFGAEGSNTSCWPAVNDILLETIKLYEEVGDLAFELFMPVAKPAKMDIGEKTVMTFICQLEGVKSLSDLAAALPHVPKKTIREDYMRIKELFDAIGGMNGIYTIATGVDNMIQLAIDIDFPHQLPVTSVSRQELLNRLMEFKTVLSLYMESLVGKGAFNAGVEASVDAIFERIADGLIGSPNVDVLGSYFSFPPEGIEKLRHMGENLPKLQKLLHHVVAILEQFNSHGLLDLPVY